MLYYANSLDDLQPFRLRLGFSGSITLSPTRWHREDICDLCLSKFNFKFIFYSRGERDTWRFVPMDQAARSNLITSCSNCRVDLICMWMDIRKMQANKKSNFNPKYMIPTQSSTACLNVAVKDLYDWTKHKSKLIRQQIQLMHGAKGFWRWQRFQLSRHDRGKM